MTTLQKSRIRRKAVKFLRNHSETIEFITVVSFLVFILFNLQLVSANADTIQPLTPTKLPAFPTPIPTVTPTPVTTVTPAQAAIEPIMSPQSVVAAIYKVWGNDGGIGLAIASCESGLNPNATHYNTNGTIDYSVFQINSIHGVISDPISNITYAYQMYKEQGTTPWNSSKYCWSK